MQNKTASAIPFLKRIISLVLLLCITYGAAAQSGNDTSVRAQIRQLNKDLEAAFNANDMETVAAYYAADAEIVYPDGYTVKGRASLDRYWGNLKDKGRGWQLTVTEIGGAGELVLQLGKSDLKYLHQNRETRSVTNFVLLWKKQPDGSYKIFRDYLTRTSF